MRTLMWEGIGVFIVVRFCLLSLQPKLFPCRTLPLGIRNVVDKLFTMKSPRSLRCSPNIFPMLCPIHIGPLFHQGFHKGWARLFFWPMDMDPLSPSGIISYFYPLHSLIPFKVGYLSGLLVLNTCFANNDQHSAYDKCSSR